MAYRGPTLNLQRMLTFGFQPQVKRWGKRQICARISTVTLSLFYFMTVLYSGSSQCNTPPKMFSPFDYLMSSIQKTAGWLPRRWSFDPKRQRPRLKEKDRLVREGLLCGDGAKCLRVIAILILCFSSDLFLQAICIYMHSFHYWFTLQFNWQSPFTVLYTHKSFSREMNAQNYASRA